MDKQKGKITKMASLLMRRQRRNCRGMEQGKYCTSLKKKKKKSGHGSLNILDTIFKQFDVWHFMSMKKSD